MLKLFGAVLIAAALVAAPADAQKKKRAPTPPGTLTLYELPNFNGERYEVTKGRVTMSLDWPVRSIGIADGESWELCEKKAYKGTCATLNASVPDTGAASTIQVVTSARPAAATAAK